MNKKKMSKRQRDIKSKLMAAICMLLVSSIMMVSTTYAWFTLSTAPEVTGITTAVGANGNLEMALQPANGNSDAITSSEGDSNKIPALKNITWGNLVDVSDDATYGLNLVSLYPAKLNATADVIGANPLSTPVYGADGRVASLTATTLAGSFDIGKAQFIAVPNIQDSAKGVRAIGISSGMTARQLAYSKALAEGVSNAGLAQKEAMKSLSNRGPSLANIAIKHALGNDTAGYTATEIGVIQAAIADLAAAMDYLETAMKNFIIAQSIAPGTVTEEAYSTIASAINAATMADLKAGSVSGAVLPATFAGDDGVIAKFIAADNNVTAASSKAAGLTENCQWAALSPVLGYLINMDSPRMQINGMTMEDIMEDPYVDAEGKNVLDDEGKPMDGKSVLIQKVFDAGTKVNMYMYSGTGIYADIADFTGRYATNTSVRVNAMGLNANVNTDMVIIPDATGTVYLDTENKLDISDYEAGAGEGSVTPISEFYGYVLDLAFRTNAANSSLYLQKTAVDRIYSDNTANENTMGHGATMTFESASKTFTDDQVKGLMGHIRIVFFDTDTMAVKKYAVLDMDSALLTEDGYQAPITLTQSDFRTKLTDDATTTDVNESVAIMELTQNQVHELSVLVYLDGETIENEHVAADQAKSMIGKMNLQFSSSATLKPMEYSALRSANENQVGSYVTVPGSNITASSGYSVPSAYAADGKLAFQFATGTVADGDKVYVSIDGAAAVEATSGEVAGVTGYYVTASGVTKDSKVVITVGAALAAPSVTGEATASLATFKDGNVTIVLKPNAGFNITGVTAATVDGTTVTATLKNNVVTFTSSGISGSSVIAITVATEAIQPAG